MNKSNKLVGLCNMATRLGYRGGAPQQDRMIRDKRKSMEKAILYSYQGAKVKDMDNTSVVAPALINPNKLKPDYDDKVISINYEYNFKPGTVFEWMNTDTKWLVYLQDLTELAYFRGDIRRCRYEISFLNEDGELVTTYAAIRGPVETKINFIQKNGISLDVPNHTLNLMLPLTDDNFHYFKRYSKFYLLAKLDYDCADEDIEDLDKTQKLELNRKHASFWRVTATDAISSPGILDITAIEYYENESMDDPYNLIADAHKGEDNPGGLIIKPLKVDESKKLINGEGFIKPKKSYEFTYEGPEKSTWSIEINGDPSIIKMKPEGRKVILQWNKTYSGQFVLKYGASEKTIVVESLF